MKIVTISDTHLAHQHFRLPIPPGDILIHAGDALLSGSFRELEIFNEWFASLPHPIKIFVAGNHDCLFETDPERARELLHPSIYYLQDSEVTVAGLRVYGSPWQPEFHDWAFNLKRGKALKEKWDFIPSGIDIPITHCPPHGIGDSFPGSQPVGCRDLLCAVKRVRPTYHIFGHIHAGHGVYTKPGQKTVYVNAAIMDESYHPTRRSIVIDI